MPPPPKPQVFDSNRQLEMSGEPPLRSARPPQPCEHLFARKRQFSIVADEAMRAPPPPVTPALPSVIAQLRMVGLPPSRKMLAPVRSRLDAPDAAPSRMVTPSTMAVESTLVPRTTWRLLSLVLLPLG